jgi:hypothetical protein
VVRLDPTLAPAAQRRPAPAAAWCRCGPCPLAPPRAQSRGRARRRPRPRPGRARASRCLHCAPGLPPKRLATASRSFIKSVVHQVGRSTAHGKERRGVASLRRYLRWRARAARPFEPSSSRPRWRARCFRRWWASNTARLAPPTCHSHPACPARRRCSTRSDVANRRSHSRRPYLCARRPSDRRPPRACPW